MFHFYWCGSPQTLNDVCYKSSSEEKRWGRWWWCWGVGSLVWGLYFFSNTPYLIQCFRENTFLKTSVNIGICLCLSVLLHYWDFLFFNPPQPETRFSEIHKFIYLTMTDEKLTDLYFYISHINDFPFCRDLLKLCEGFFYRYIFITSFFYYYSVECASAHPASLFLSSPLLSLSIILRTWSGRRRPFCPMINWRALNLAEIKTAWSMLKCPSVSPGVSAGVTAGQSASPAKWLLRWRGMDRWPGSEWMEPDDSCDSENASLCSSPFFLFLFLQQWTIYRFSFFFSQDVWNNSDNK